MSILARYHSLDTKLYGTFLPFMTSVQQPAPLKRRAEKRLYTAYFWKRIDPTPNLSIVFGSAEIPWK